MIHTTTVRPDVQVVNPAPQRLIYRRPIVGGLVEGIVIREEGDWLRLQVEGEPFHKSIHRTDIVSWILDTAASAETRPQSNVDRPNFVFPASPAPHITIKPVDARFAYNRYKALLCTRYSQWQDEREYHGLTLTVMRCDTAAQRARLARYEARYRAVLKHVNRAQALLTSEQRTWMQDEQRRLSAARFTRFSSIDEAYIADEQGTVDARRKASV